MTATHIRPPETLHVTEERARFPWLVGLAAAVLVALGFGAVDDAALAETSTQAGAGDGWQPAETVTPTKAGLRKAVVATRVDGTAVAAWVPRADGRAGPVTVSSRSQDGTWSGARALSRPLRRGGDVDVAVAAGGVASVVWSRKVDGVRRVEEAHLRDGSWTEPRMVGRGHSPRTTVDGEGDTTLVWAQEGLKTVRRESSGRWHEPVRLSSERVWDVAVDSNAAGAVAVTWIAERVQAALRPASGGWTATRTVRDRHATAVQVAVGPGGRALALWTQGDIWDEDRHDYVGGVQWFRSTADGTWSRGRQITDRLGEEGGHVSLSMNGTGNALAVWTQVYRTGDRRELWAARFDAAGTWSRPRKVDTGRRDWSYVGLAWLDERGVAHVVADNQRVWAFQQRRGHRWRGAEIADGTLHHAHGIGATFVVLLTDHGLRARVLTTTKPSATRGS